MLLRIAQKQIRAVAERLFEGHLAAPFGDFGMVATDENFGNFPAAKIGRPGVMGKIEKAEAIRQSFMQLAGRRAYGTFQQTKGFVLGRSLVAERAGEQACYCINNQSGGQFTAGKYEVANGVFFRGEMFGDTLVDTFIAAADENDSLQLG